MILNFHRVDDLVFRSGQPATVEEWRWAAQQGVRRVVSLNGSTDSMAERVGLPVVMLPIGDDEAQSTFRDPSVLDRIDQEVDRHPHVPVLLHCTEGRDRTGIAVARYRVRACGWTKQQALEEWERIGSHRYRGLLAAWDQWVP